MSYSDAQFEKTKLYIQQFFANRLNHYAKFKEAFTKYLDSTFRQINIFQPDSFEFSKNSHFMPGFASWITENIVRAESKCPTSWQVRNVRCVQDH